MLAYNGESSAIMNDDFVLSDLTSINNRNEDDAYQWIQTYTCSKYLFFMIRMRQEFYPINQWSLLFFRWFDRIFK